MSKSKACSMLKQIYIFGIIAIMAFSSTLNAQTGVLVYDESGVVFLPQINVAGIHYSATLQLTPSENSLPAFSILEADVIGDTDRLDDVFAIYDADERTVLLFNVLFGDTFYDIHLQGQDDGTFAIVKLQNVTSISLLFMVNSAAGSFKETGTYNGKTIGNHFIIDANTPLIAFSDRPHRFSETRENGLLPFPEFYANSDFAVNPPNTTFSGTSITTSSVQSTVFEMENPIVADGQFIIPVRAAIGDQQLPAYGDYANLNFVIDGFFSAIKDSVTQADTRGQSSIDNAAEKAAAREEAASSIEERTKLAQKQAQEKAQQLVKDAALLAGKGEVLPNEGYTLISDAVISTVDAGVNLSGEALGKINNLDIEDMTTFAKGIAEANQKIIVQLNKSLKSLEPIKVTMAIMSKNQDKMLDLAVQILAENADDLQYYLYQGKDIFADDVWFVLESQGAATLGSYNVLTVGMAINLNTLFAQLGSVSIADVSIDNKGFANSGINIDKSMIQQIISKNALLKAYVAGKPKLNTSVKTALDDVNVGLMLGNALQGASIEVNLGVLSDDSGAVTVRMAMPIDNLLDVANVNELTMSNYVFQGISINVAENLRVDPPIAPHYKHSLSFTDTFGILENPQFLLIEQQLNRCLTAYTQAGVALLDDCGGSVAGFQTWQWHDQHIYSIENGQRTNKCLVAAQDAVSLSDCDSAVDDAKTWRWQSSQLYSDFAGGVCLGVKDQSLLTSVDCNNAQSRLWTAQF
jgi:hypothetical protein